MRFLFGFSHGDCEKSLNQLDQSNVYFTYKYTSGSFEFKHYLLSNIAGGNPAYFTPKTIPNFRKDNPSQFFNLIYTAQIRHRPSDKKSLLIKPYLQMNADEFYLSYLPNNPHQKNQSIGAGFHANFNRSVDQSINANNMFNIDLCGF